MTPNSRAHDPFAPHTVGAESVSPAAPTRSPAPVPERPAAASSGRRRTSRKRAATQPSKVPAAPAPELLPVEPVEIPTAAEVEVEQS